MSAAESLPTSSPQAPAVPGEGTTPPAAAAAEQLSPKLAAIMRREAEAVRKMREAKTTQQQIQAEREALSAEKAKIDEFNRLWKENPLKAIQDRGLDYNQLTMMQLNNGQMTPEQKFDLLHQEIRALRQEREEERSKFQEDSKVQAQREEEEEIKAFQSDIGRHIQEQAEKYPLTQLYNRADLVYAIIDAHHKKTLNPETGEGEVLGIDKASELAEAKLLAEFKKGQELISKAEAAKAPPAPPAAPGRFHVPQAQSWVEKPIKTLAGIQQSVPSLPTRPLSDDERVANAVARLRAARQR